jgi:hypothetical protein
MSVPSPSVLTRSMTISYTSQEVRPLKANHPTRSTLINGSEACQELTNKPELASCRSPRMLGPVPAHSPLF